MGSQKQFPIFVSTLETEFEFAIHKDVTGRELLEKVLRILGLREIWYFGLEAVDVKGTPYWLDLNLKVVGELVKHRKKSEINEEFLRLKFRAKYFPENVSEVKEDKTMKLLYLQAKEAIISDAIFCPLETDVVLASYAMQAKFGDIDAEKTTGETLLSRRIQQQYRLCQDQLINRIVAMWSEHAGMTSEQAIWEYMQTAQKLQMYGVSYFQVRNKQGFQRWIGIEAAGISLYGQTDRLIPNTSYCWSDIRKVSYHDKKLIVKFNDPKKQHLILFAERHKINKQILSLCLGYHELHLRRIRMQTMQRAGNALTDVRRQLFRHSQQQSVDYDEECSESTTPTENENLSGNSPMSKDNKTVLESVADDSEPDMVL